MRKKDGNKERDREIYENILFMILYITKKNILTRKFFRLMTRHFSVIQTESYCTALVRVDAHDSHCERRNYLCKKN